MLGREGNDAPQKVYFWRREESNINLDNCKENEWNWFMMERRLVKCVVPFPDAWSEFCNKHSIIAKGYSLMRGQNFAMRIAEINRQVEADKY